MIELRGIQCVLYITNKVKSLFKAAGDKGRPKWTNYVLSHVLLIVIYVQNMNTDVLLSVEQKCLVASTQRIYICRVHKCILKRLHNSCSIFSWNWITKLTLVEFCRYAYLQRLYQILFNKRCFWIFNPELAFCMFHLMYNKGCDISKYTNMILWFRNKNIQPYAPQKLNIQVCTLQNNIHIKFCVLQMFQILTQG